MTDDSSVGLTPEQEARREIDAQLAACGWVLQDHKHAAVAAAQGVAVREVPVGAGRADCVLFVDRQAVGVIEAKPAGTTLTGVEPQTLGYRQSYPGELPAADVGGALPFGYESTGVETRFTCGLDPAPTSRRVCAFHRPETHERLDGEGEQRHQHALLVTVRAQRPRRRNNRHVASVRGSREQRPAGQLGAGRPAAC